MSRSKYVSVGNTGGLILDGKYDDFATNAGLQSIKNEIVSAIEASNVNTTGRQKLYPASNLQFEMIPARSMSVIAIDFKNDGFSYGIDHGWIARSDDGWQTKENGVSFASLGVGVANRLCRWSDGTFCAVTDACKVITFDDLSGTNTKVNLDIGDKPASSINASFWEDGVNRIVLLGDYEQGTSYPPKLYMSLDGGETFTVILEGKALPSGNNHWHATCYDRFSGTIWASQGDGGSATTYFSTDLGSTWIEVSLKEGKHSSYAQPTLILPFPNRMVFGRDGGGIPPGLDEWVRDGKNITPSNVFLPEPALEFKDTYGSHTYYPSLSYTAVFPLNPLVAYVSFPYRSSDKQEISFIFATGDGGESWHSVYAGLKKMIVRGTDGVNLFCTNGIGPGSIYSAKLVEWV
jgi:hypothetical protein